VGVGSCFDSIVTSPTLTPEGERLLRSAKALLAQSHEFEKIAEFHPAQRRKFAHHSRGRRVISANCVGGSPKLFALTFPYVQARPRVSGFPRYQSTRLPMANCRYWRDVFQKLKWITSRLFAMSVGVDLLPYVHMEFPYSGDCEYCRILHLAPFRQNPVRGSQKKETASPDFSMTAHVLMWCS